MANAGDFDWEAVADPGAGPEVSGLIFHGLLSKLVEVFGPHTEADPVAIVAQFLVLFGNAIGRGPGMDVGETRHHLNENLLLVGTSSRARKGDSGNIAQRPLRDADPVWAGRIAAGLSSGEGLIHAVRDPLTQTDRKGKEKTVDEGVTDKRLPVIEPEFSSVLKQFGRQGNVLSTLIRNAWDSPEVLRTLTKNNPTKATGAHISIIGHTTPEDLDQHLTDTDIANGLGNRFLIILANREKLLPSPGKAEPEDARRIARQVEDALSVARTRGTIRRSHEAEEAWYSGYPGLTQDRPGLAGKLLARSESHVLRLSALYALLAQSPQIEIDHLEAALALWKYAEDSVMHIFGNRTGRRIADRILAQMLPGESLDLTEIRRLYFSNHVNAESLQADLELLKAWGFVVTNREITGGRARTIVTRTEKPTSGSPNGTGLEGGYALKAF